MKGLETTARELASSVVERGEVDCFKERDGQADASALTLAATSSDATRVCDATALKVPAECITRTDLFLYYSYMDHVVVCMEVGALAPAGPEPD